MVWLVIRWDAIRELQIILPGCSKEFRADRYVKEARNMDKNSKGKVSYSPKELGFHPVENPEPFKDFNQRNNMIRFVF